MEARQDQDPQQQAPAPQRAHLHQPQPSQPHQITTDLQQLLTQHQFVSRTANSTPMSSPGLFSPFRPNMNVPLHSASDVNTPSTALGSPYHLHPLHGPARQVRETDKALVDRDHMTGRKLINHYEVIEEIGRGMHGKVKLARNLENGENVAIKIVPRFSKRRRLGKVTVSPEDKTKKEIAILKKVRHPNVVALLEIIDDPELKKIYMVLEHAELGEIVWRKKGLPNICAIERRRVENEARGEPATDEEEHFIRLRQRRKALDDVKRARLQQKQEGAEDPWSMEHGYASDVESTSLPSSSYAQAQEAFFEGSRATSRAPSRGTSVRSGSRAATPHLSEFDYASVDAETGSDLETPGPLHSHPGSAIGLDGGLYAAPTEDAALRGRSPSMADSIISHMSSIDFAPQPLDEFTDDFSYVPCFTIEDARAVFRDTVLGLEYLHYQGIVHRDIKPANLLRAKDHRIKISDFGVSYFGRPIREGEQTDFVSESEAQDFDDDLELAKTVGTPAFFAPELCYTDLDGPPPRISEQIDVWSLGVTLYCLIYGRIPFSAEDEFQMWKKIAKEDVYIPRRRLRPVDPSSAFPASTSLYKRVNSEPYRDDNELAYEDIDDSLYDLLSRMLIKNPDKRIRLREVKRHKWVVQGIDEIAWIDDTDPSRRTAGRKIQVDERDMSRAVVPLTFLERARSAIKKTVDKLTQGRTDKTDSPSRRRADSSATSSVGETPAHGFSTPHPRDGRRKSLRGDENHYFAAVTPEHPLSQSVAASPAGSPIDKDRVSVGAEIKRHASGSAIEFNGKPDVSERPPSRTSSSSIGLVMPQRHSRGRSKTNFLTLTPPLSANHTSPVTLAAISAALESDDPLASLRKGSDMKSLDDASRSRSVDRGLFASHDKRASAKISLSTAIAPGSIEPPRRTTPFRADVPEAASEPTTAIVSPSGNRTFPHGQPKSKPNMHERASSASELAQRPLTAQRVQQMEAGTPPPRVYNSSTPESFARAKRQMALRQQREDEDEAKRRQFVSARADIDPAYVPCPPSPDDGLSMEAAQPPSRRDTIGTACTSTSTIASNLVTPLTSPSEVVSPTSHVNLVENKNDTQSFRSGSSLPALLSSTSSVSADAEVEFLPEPGLVQRSSLIETTESLTPPAMTKEPIHGFPIEAMESDNLPVPLQLAQGGNHGDGSHRYSSVLMDEEDDEEDDDSNSDDGIVMMKSTRKAPPKDSRARSPGNLRLSPKRRDTQTSIGSTETAKKVLMQSK